MSKRKVSINDFDDWKKDKLDRMCRTILLRYNKVHPETIARILGMSVDKMNGLARQLKRLGYDVPKVRNSWKQKPKAKAKKGKKDIGLEEIINLAIKNLKENGRLAPVAIVNADDGNAVLSLKIGDTNEKIATFKAVRQYADKVDAKSVTTILESYIKKVKKPDEIDMSRSLREQEGVGEVIMVIKQYSDGSGTIVSVPFSKAGEDIITEKPEKHNFKKGEIEGLTTIW